MDVELMDDISTIDRSSGEILSVNGSVITLSHPSIITLSAAKENVVLFVREGRNLVVALKSGGKIILVDFYPETGEDSDNVLVIKDEDGALWWVEHPGTAFQYTTLLPDIESLMLPQDNSSIASGLVGFTGLGGGLAGLAALASRGEGSRLTNNSDSGSEGGAGSDSDSDAEGGAGSDSDSDAEGGAGSDSDSEGGSGSDSDSDAEGGAGSDSDSDSEGGAGSDSDSDAEGGAGSDSDSDAEGGAGSDSDSDSEGGAGSDSDSDSDSDAEGGAGSDSDSDSEGGAGSDSDSDSDSDAEGGAGSDSDSDSEGGAGSDSDSDSEGGAGSDSDSDAEGGAGSDSDSDAEGGSDSDSDSDSEGGSGSDSDSDSEGGAGSDSDSDSDSEGGSGSDSDSDAEGGAGSDSDSDAEGGAGSDSDSDAEGGAGSDSDSDAEGGAGSDSDSDAEGGAGSDSDSDAEGGAGSDSDSDAEGGAGSDSDSDSDSEGGADSDSDTELDLKLSDDNAVLNGESKSYTVDNGTSSQTSFAVVSIGLGDILDLSVIDIKKQAKVSVEEGTTRSITLQGKGGGVSIGSVFDLLIYKLNPETGNYDKYHVEKNFLKILLLGGVGDEVEITLPAGDYVFLLDQTSGIAVATGVTLDFLTDVTIGMEVFGESINGNVISGSEDGAGMDIVPEGTVVSSVNGIKLSGSGETTIVGKYGFLTIDSQGNYSYTLNDGIKPESIQDAEVFVYEVTAPDGSKSEAKLTIDIKVDGSGGGPESTLGKGEEAELLQPVDDNVVLDGEVDIALAETILLDISETIDHETFDFVLSSEDNGETIHLADIEINNLLSDAGDKNSISSIPFDGTEEVSMLNVQAASYPMTSAVLTNTVDSTVNSIDYIIDFDSPEV
ncbi:hypothetical protein CGL57_09505 [Edwardsiella anguillarum]|nr:hypothetical protein CGL57_09505 [Edwardsiella anguillarum]